MIQEDYVSFEISKLLKKKGFDVKCEYCYAEFNKDDIEVIGLSPAKCAQSLKEDRYPYITLQMAMKWLREVHMLHIWIGHAAGEGLPWYYEIHGISDGKVKHIGGIECGSYEVACESAIKYCLENLI